MLGHWQSSLKPGGCEDPSGFVFEVSLDNLFSF